MKLLSRPILAAWAAAAALLPSLSHADTSGLYASVSGLYVVPSDHHAIPVALPVGQAEHDLGMEPGGGALAALGYASGEGWRAEIEAGYRSVEVGKIDGWTGAYDREPLSVAGTFRTPSLMFNVYYRLRDEGPVPWLGAGIGVARHEVHAESAHLTIGGQRGRFVFRGRETVPAWQAMAGVAHAVAENVELRLGYRFFQTREAHFGPDELGYRTHNVEAGVSFAF